MTLNGRNDASWSSARTLPFGRASRSATAPFPRRWSSSATAFATRGSASTIMPASTSAGRSSSRWPTRRPASPSEAAAHLAYAQCRRPPARRARSDIIEIERRSDGRQPAAALRDAAGARLGRCAGPRPAGPAPRVRSSPFRPNGPSRLFERAPMTLRQVRNAGGRGQARARFRFARVHDAHCEKRVGELHQPERRRRCCPGSDPKLASEHIVLMGHLDHLGPG